MGLLSQVHIKEKEISFSGMV